MITTITKADLANQWGRDSLIGKEKKQSDENQSDYLQGLLITLFIAGAYIAMAQVASHYFSGGNADIQRVFRNITIASGVIGGVAVYVITASFTKFRKDQREFHKPLTQDQINEIVLKEKSNLATAQALRQQLRSHVEGNMSGFQWKLKALELENSEAMRVVKEERAIKFAGIAKVLTIFAIQIFATISFVFVGAPNTLQIVKITGITSGGLMALFYIRSLLQGLNYSVPSGGWPQKWRELEEVRMAKLDVYISSLEGKESWTTEPA
jgi:hypothetical protein